MEALVILPIDHNTWEGQATSNLMSTSIDWWLSESALLTTFITPFGRYCFQHLPFGISSAPEHFQRHMQEILEGVQGVVCLMDDVLVIAQKSNSSESPTSSKQPRASKRPKSPSTPSKRPQLPSTSSKQPKLSFRHHQSIPHLQHPNCWLGFQHHPSTTISVDSRKGQKSPSITKADRNARWSNHPSEPQSLSTSPIKLTATPDEEEEKLPYWNGWSNRRFFDLFNLN